MRQFIFQALATASLIGCGSAEVESDPDRAEEQREILDACNLGACPGWKPIYDFPDAIRDGASCVLQKLEAGESVHTTLTQVADGGGQCAAMEEFYAGASGAYIWRSYDNECDDSDEPQRYEITRCELRPRADYTTCLEELAAATSGSTMPCDAVADWVTSCTVVEDATCP